MSTEPSKIFIASSGRTLTLAEKLRDAFDETKSCKATLWTEEGRRSPGATIIEMLQSAARKYDFAVVILARDDVFVKDGGEALKARDNCVFEAGLFIAALGRDRCFLLNSVPRKDLPSDLSGIISIPFNEPDDLTSRAKCADAIAKAAGALKDVVEDIGRMKSQESFPSLSKEDLLERETLDSRLKAGRVVVTSVQPLEVEYPAARQLRHNMFQHGIRYIFFIHGSDEGVEKSCRLLQMVLLAERIEEKDAGNAWRRADTVENMQDEILADLALICRHQGLKIVFLPDKPALEYCIHNAGDDGKAKLFLKHSSGRFVEWAERSTAYEFWEEIRRQRFGAAAIPTALCAASAFGGREQEFRECFRRELGQYFPNFHAQVEAMCFGVPAEQPAGSV